MEYEDKVLQMYGEVVEYAKYLERMLVVGELVDEEFLNKLRKIYIKPATNVAQEWLNKQLKGEGRLL